VDVVDKMRSRPGMESQAAIAETFLVCIVCYEIF
jgi:hypothetical protein